ncbi:DNA polymerase I [Ligilactobacillus sp. WC1T17]|uniref:DNA polymerase I n=1 Tax=Ligilactobacillus ruminis TaxID=1623 RepID=A0ABY1A9N8_9LACO|nr:DNA polymerase I [Ligilactobacillus ruminis]
MQTDNKMLLIDGNSLTFRGFYALFMQTERFVNQQGLHTSAVYSFKLMLDKVLDLVKPDKVLVAFDAGKKTFRTQKFADYKGGRKKTPAELTEQFPYVKQLLDGYGIKHYELVNYEADDIIGTMAKKAEAAGYQVTIVTGDHDLTQLVTNKITVALTVKGVTELEFYTPEYLYEKLGLTPKQIIDLKALSGDTSDNYPGVTKVGEKTALKLLNEYESLENLYANLETMKKSKLKEHLEADKEVAFACQDLATIRTDAPVSISLEELDFEGQDAEKLQAFYQELDFNKFLSELRQTEVKNDVEVHVLTKDILAKLSLKKPVSLYVEMADENYHTADFWGFSLNVAGKTYASEDLALLQEPKLKEYLETTPVDVFDGKKTYTALKRLGITLAGVDFDLLLVSYLLNNTDNSNDLGTLCQKQGYLKVAGDDDVYGKGAKKQKPAADIFLQHLTTKALAIYELKEKLMAALVQNEQADLYIKIERPLSLVLAQMEISGIKVDRAKLEEMGSNFTELLADLEQRIYQAAGESFNINSPKQLGTILFEKLSLPVIKKTKTGYSTASDVLEKLTDYDIVADVLQYRQYAKLKSTYIDGLLKVIAPDGKVHTRYTQTLTTTGRLSSVDPNLQNIPVRLEEGKKIRQAFVPSQDGWEIFTSDYSQIELRVLAHISQDENMKQAFKDGIDIHAKTAMNIFNLTDPSEVTANMRRQAKAVNFGIVYGISDFGLAQNIGISRKQAKEFIAGYFDLFPGVKKYMDEIVQKAKKQGYVETIFHRRRYLEGINSKNFNQRSFAQRTAMNTPIQGSAADIIKIAMIKMQAELTKRNLKAKMLLQVHDELIFEAPQTEISILEELVPQIMDSAVDLDVPLKVESGHGQTWFDTK